MNANIICTQEFYRSITAKDLCGCGYCRNYYRQIKKPIRRLPHISLHWAQTLKNRWKLRRWSRMTRGCWNTVAVSISSAETARKIFDTALAA